LPIFVHKTFQWSSLGGGLIFLPICVPSLLEPVIGIISDRYGIRWLTVAGFIAALPFYVLLRLVNGNTMHDKILLCALLFLIGASISIVLPPLLAEVTKIVLEKEHSEPGVFGSTGAMAQAYGLFNVVFAAGTSLGPVWGGYVQDSAGWGTMAWSLGLLSAVTSVPMFIWAGGPLNFSTRSIRRQSTLVDGSVRRWPLAADEEANAA